MKLRPPLARRLRTALFLASILAVAASAQEPGIREAIAPGPFWVGQRIPLQVELLSPTWFSGATTFELPEVPGGVLLQVGERPTVSSETIEGQAYSVQRHELALFLQREGACTIPPITARFGVAGPPGEPPTELKLQTAELTAELRRPPGAEGLAYLVSAKELVVVERWEPAPGEARVGDAFTRRITRRAPDLPAMAFPPLPALEVPGLAAYPKPPVVLDRTERGEFTGEREDAITYVCESAGTSSLPALAITWWDTDDEVLRRELLEAVTLVIAPGPEESAEAAVAGDAATASGERPSAGSLAALGLLLAAATVGVWKRASLVACFEGWKKHREASEAAQFARLLEACRRAGARAALSALYSWLEVADRTRCVATLEELLKRSPDQELALALEKLQGAAVRGEPVPSARELERGLRRARARLTHQARAPQALPPLNPTG